ncbi:EamA family transporter [Lactobacillus sp. S2-2]|uniref:DMT family transporter n=1 Tax=Lactobacillus sp. S2-2 TaxID=2692917 RepID=UPI001F1E24FC|nr:DMT family transporter [Lactobacillus sp. S2-2]MCF6514645.1 EamA family transporter [Lactobacillus sp. S2-2]
MESSKKYIGVLLAISGAIMWGIQGPISQALFSNHSFSTEWLMSVKMLFAGILILLFTKFVQKKKILDVWKNKKNWVVLILYSVFGLSAVQYLFLITVRYSNAAVATIMQSLGTVFIIILTILIYKKAPSLQEGMGVFVALIGTWLLVTKGDFTHLGIGFNATFFGLLLALAGAIQTMLPVNLLNKYTTFPIIGWAMIIGGILFNIYHPFWMDVPELDFKSILVVAFIVIFGTILSFICFMSSLKYITPTTAGLLGTFEPLSATLGAVLFLNISFNFFEVVGGVMVLSTVFILAIPNKKIK